MPGMRGILDATGVQNLRIENCTFADAPVGVSSDTPINLQTDNCTFKNVGQAFSMAGGTADVRRTRIYDPELADRTSSGPRAFAGYQRVQKPLPAMCGTCKSVFPSVRYGFYSSKFYSTDNIESCRVCGAFDAKLAEGLFDLSKEVIEVLTGPDVTYAMLQAILTVARGAISGGWTDTQIADQLGRTAPRLQGIIKRSAPYGAAALMWILALIGGAADYLTINDSISNKESATAEIIERSTVTIDCSTCAISITEDKSSPAVSAIIQMPIAQPVEQSPGDDWIEEKAEASAEVAPRPRPLVDADER